jgi:hypothetical protein
VILVRFAIALAPPHPESSLPGMQDCSLPEWRREVLCSAMIISDDFSVSCKSHKGWDFRGATSESPRPGPRESC